MSERTLVNELDKLVEDSNIYNKEKSKTQKELNEENEVLRQCIESELSKKIVEGTTIEIEDAAQYDYSIDIKANTYQEQNATPMSPHVVHKVCGEINVHIVKNLYNPKTIYRPNNGRQNVANEIKGFKKNQKYYVYANNANWLTIFEYDINNNRIATHGNSNGTRKLNFIVNPDTVKIEMLFFLGYYESDILGDFKNIYFCEEDQYIQFNNIKTDFLIDLGDIRLYTSDTYKEYIFKNTKKSLYYRESLEKNKWYKFGNSHKIILDGTQEMITYSSYGKPAIGVLINEDATHVYCDSYCFNSRFDLNDYAIANTFRKQVQIRDCRFDITDGLADIDSFREYLQNNNIEITVANYYNDKYTLIEDEDLVQQLDELYDNLKLTKGKNKIIITGEDMAPNFKITYYASNSVIFQSQIDELKAMVLENS